MPSETDDKDWMVVGSSTDKRELAVASKAIKTKWGDRWTLEIAPSSSLPSGYDLRLRHN